MTDAQTKYSPAPWAYEYSPYTAQDGTEIPAFTVNDAECDKVLETNEDTPAELQEANARLAAAAPELLDALTHFFNVMHDYESSVQKGYIDEAMKQAREVIESATGKAA